MRWIKHDTDANQDAKLQNVLLDYGLEGYGLYWYCIELIAGRVDKDNITFELEHDARIIARNTGCTPQKVEEMMKYFVKVGLFENCEGVITCLKLARRLDKSMTSNAQMREIIENFKSHDAIMTQSEKPMQDKNRLDKNRVDKNIVINEETKEKRKRFVPPSQNDVYQYMGEYAQSKGKVISDQEPEKFMNFYIGKNWYVGKNKMKDWKATARNWLLNSFEKQQQSQRGNWGNTDALAGEFSKMLNDGDINL